MFSPTLACRWLRDNGRPNPGVPSGPPELRAAIAILAPAAEASLLQASLVLSEMVSHRFLEGRRPPSAGADPTPRQPLRGLDCSNLLGPLRARPPLPAPCEE